MLLQSVLKASLLNIVELIQPLVIDVIYIENVKPDLNDAAFFIYGCVLWLLFTCDQIEIVSLE